MLVIGSKDEQTDRQTDRRSEEWRVSGLMVSAFHSVFDPYICDIYAVRLGLYSHSVSIQLDVHIVTNKSRQPSKNTGEKCFKFISIKTVAYH